MLVLTKFLCKSRSKNEQSNCIMCIGLNHYSILVLVSTRTLEVSGCVRREPTCLPPCADELLPPLALTRISASENARRATAWMDARMETHNFPPLLPPSISSGSDMIERLTDDSGPPVSVQCFSEPPHRRKSFAVSQFAHVWSRTTA